MAMKMEITKTDFERSILVATSSHSEVFDSVEPHFEEVYNRLQQQFLGYVGESALEASERLCEAVVKAVCLGAFLEVVRHLDLVLTPTGFGVVSNGEVSPASSSRVEQLIEQCRVAYVRAEGEMLTWLTATKGWGESEQAQQSILMLVYTYDQYSFQTKRQLTSQQWNDQLAALTDADATLRRLISDEQMDDFLLMERGAKERDSISGTVIFRLRRMQILLAENLMTAYANERARLLNFMEQFIEKFPIYAHSSAYKANHFKEFKNEKSKTAYVFNA